MDETLGLVPLALGSRVLVLSNQESDFVGGKKRSSEVHLFVVDQGSQGLTERARSGRGRGLREREKREASSHW